MDEAVLAGWVVCYICNSKEESVLTLCVYGLALDALLFCTRLDALIVEPNALDLAIPARIAGLGPLEMRKKVSGREGKGSSGGWRHA